LVKTRDKTSTHNRKKKTGCNRQKRTDKRGHGNCKTHVLDFVTHQYSHPIPNFTAGLEAPQLITNSEQTATVLYRWCDKISRRPSWTTRQKKHRKLQDEITQMHFLGSAVLVLCAAYQHSAYHPGCGTMQQLNNKSNFTVHSPNAKSISLCNKRRSLLSNTCRASLYKGTCTRHCQGPSWTLSDH
jgi:hypothetical protein